MMRNEEKCFQIPGGSMLCGKHYGSHRDPLAKGIAWSIANDQTVMRVLSKLNVRIYYTLEKR